MKNTKNEMGNDKTTIRLKRVRKKHNSPNTAELLSKLLLKIEKLENRVKYLELDSVHLYEMLEGK